ncbi:hypothetical protein COV06_00270 [Candidatus Uhrbacteria bacterium CG10_big_fil_rev_8_21_14_0_10_50_16]|uniref:Type II secretion system protein GspG C-terminal domain-containing protein n=1 Tax=Candidatus Uhrbacteria bacterium CG10_big_fil_rev_8_21_14_0_10_50_16 TaxID=1975039 RepID=A0A2H0RN14_9BACT|nr:MAG: hypothetical protein COV06_00270 [Candidatus Uhrbacteria bacterium CG10_big_fil_rev_8_21_14_0_10_50_16]
MHIRFQNGLTLLEIFLVVVAIGIIVGIVILAINPEKQLSDTRNTQRRTDVSTIANAVYQYSLEHEGSLPKNITTTATEICAKGRDCTDLIDLSALTLREEYLISIPEEPQKTNPNGAGYMMSKIDTGRITVEAQFTEQDAVISVTR